MSDNDGNGSISSFSNSPVNITVKTQGIESERREEDGKTRDDIYNSLSSLSEAEISSSANIDSPLNPSYSSKSSSISSISIADEGAYFSNALVLNDGEADDNVLNSGNQDLNSTTSRSDSNISSINGDANPKFQPDIEVYSSDYESASSSVSYLQTSSSPSKSNNLLDLDQSIPTILPTDLISTDQDETSVSSFVSQKTKPLSISGGSEEFQSAFSSLPVEKPFSAPFSSSSYSSSSKVSGTWSYSSCLSRDEESAIGCLKSDYSAAAPSKLSSTPNNDASENSSFKDPVFSIISSAGESENSAEYFDNYIQDGESDGEGHESTYQREEEEYDRYRAAVSEIENQFYETCVAHLGSSKRQSLNTPTRFQSKLILFLSLLSITSHYFQITCFQILLAIC